MRDPVGSVWLRGLPVAAGDESSAIVKSWISALRGRDSILRDVVTGGEPRSWYLLPSAMCGGARSNRLFAIGRYQRLNVR